MAGGRCDSLSAREREHEGAEDATHQPGGVVMHAHEDGKSRRCGCSLRFAGCGSVVRCLGGLVPVFSGLARECWVLGCVVAHIPGRRRAPKPFMSVEGAGFLPIGGASHVFMEGAQGARRGLSPGGRI
jgi:hypothetical protein